MIGYLGEGNTSPNRLFTASLFSTSKRKCEGSEREAHRGGGSCLQAERARRNREAVDIFGKKSASKLSSTCSSLSEEMLKFIV